MHELLRSYPVVVTQAVAWGEMDAFHHVNNVVYFRYFENARLAYFLEMGWNVATLPEDVGPILATTSAKFRHALTYPDTISIGASIPEIQADRLVMRHIIVSEKLGKIATEGESSIVTYHYLNRLKVPVPEGIRQKIREIEGRVGNKPGEVR